jgi:Tfp pilus assembly protein PilF
VISNRPTSSLAFTTSSSPRWDSSTPTLGVIARTSVLSYAGQHQPIDKIGRELHVDYILDGTVRRVGERFRVTAALIQVSDQTQLWSETYELRMGDVLSMQEDIGRRVANALAVELLPESQRRLQQSATTNPAAYEAYLRGRYLWSVETGSSLEESAAQFQRAIDLDPDYAAAYAGLADTYNVLGGYGFVPAAAVFPNAEQAARKALSLAPNLADAYNSLAFASFYYDWNWDVAESQFRKALELNPNNQLAHEFYSSFLHAMGRLDEADAENRIARELDPLSAWMYDDAGWILLSRQKPFDAIPEFERAIALNPKFPAGHLSLALALARTAQFDLARAAHLQKARELGGDPTRVLEIQGSIQALAGDLPAAQATAHQLESGNIHGRVSPYSIALIYYTAMGKKDKALDWLDTCYQEKDTWIVWTSTLVEWAPLRTEPRFLDLMQRLKLPARRPPLQSPALHTPRARSQARTLPCTIALLPNPAL